MASNPSKTSFLDLPLEIRQMIYRACLVQDLDVYIPTDAFRHIYQDGALIKPESSAREKLHHYSLPVHSIPYLALSSTCRSVHNDLWSFVLSRPSKSDDAILFNWRITMRVDDIGPVALGLRRAPCPPTQLKTLDIEIVGSNYATSVDNPSFSTSFTGQCEVLRQFLIAGPTLRTKTAIAGPIKPCFVSMSCKRDADDPIARPQLTFFLKFMFEAFQVFPPVDMKTLMISLVESKDLLSLLTGRMGNECQIVWATTPR